MRIALLGTRGVPARYGGFETAVEEVGQRLALRGHEVTVFCRGGNSAQRDYLGMRLLHLPTVRRKILDTPVHTALSSVHPASHRSDVVVIFNAANALFSLAFRASRVPVALHVDGLEWMRSKWGPTGQKFYRWSERLAVRYADVLISDAVGIRDYFLREYGANSTFIPYGAPLLGSQPSSRALDEFGLARGGYHLVVARFEPENHVLEAVQGYVRSRSRMPLVVVGGAPYSAAYTAAVTTIAEQDDRVMLLGPLWDQELLDSLYGHSCTYVHGHSVGGTNPSLLRAMGASAPVLAYDVVFNREVLQDHAWFWSDASSLALALEEAELAPGLAGEHAAHALMRATVAYNWDDVADRYEALCYDLFSQRR